MVWRLLQTGALSAAENMAIDEAILLGYSKKTSPPTIRFYTWQPAAVSIGYFQHSDAEIDFAACQKQGIDVVRRLTGGRAVLHDEELTYSIVVGEDYPEIPMTVTASYRYLSQGLMNGLAKIGVQAQMTKPQAAYAHKTQMPSSAACFDAPSHYELTVQQKKLIGSAQVRKYGVILQHGSILTAFSADKLVSILKLEDERRQQIKAMLRQRVVDLQTVLGYRVRVEELVQVLAASFSETLAIELVDGGLTAEEKACAAELLVNKYQNNAWIHKR
ncbi:MAG TPA: lipoate--protein ligase family protein [Candidatus Avacidaminococcus intestinavium]|uniref:Lipoate--protein ligase family protein n=1 Tax=Candidatus Avacidaminococcus intestinavium TaxID=2840684 RepID=A0A9D1MQK3_9FIRM|nr:lipoate--protein ligase family protein [Candidatus Avacidaminococcus intestinavium]